MDPSKLRQVVEDAHRSVDNFGRMVRENRAEEGRVYEDALHFNDGAFVFSFCIGSNARTLLGGA